MSNHFLQSFSIANDTMGTLSNSALSSEFKESNFSAFFLGVKSEKGNDAAFVATSIENLSGQQTIDMNAVLAVHNGDPIAANRIKISNARDFFDDMLNNYIAKTMLDGIGPSGKTKAVIDYFENLIRYGQIGSLKEVKNEIDVFLAAGVPGNLSPFVTAEKLNKLKTKIDNYLGT